MLAILLATCLGGQLPQEPVANLASAVSVRGDAELTPAAAMASARAKVEEHVREMWQERAKRTVVDRRPFWMPEVLTNEAVRRWLAGLSYEKLVSVVDREDRERIHEFGNSYQTTLWVAEEPRSVRRGESELRGTLRRLERTTAIKGGGVLATWFALAALIAWLDRLSRGYMTGRLYLLGLCGAVAVPVAAFLV
jgi:hypothetical protein